MKRVVISQPMYLPWAGFLAQLSMADALVWLDDAQFSKGSFTNRVQVPKGDGFGWLSIPLVGQGSRQLIGDLEGSQADWVARHQSTLRNVYGKSPHYDDIQTVMSAVAAAPSVCSAIIQSSEALAEAVGIPLPRAQRSSEMGIDAHGSDRVLQLIRAVGGTHYLTGHGAKNYLDHEAFEEAGVTVDYMDYAPRPWPQPNRNFTPYVTGLDLVANVPVKERAGHLNPASVGWKDVLGMTTMH